jgi:glutathione-regulated potassium-efflux system ancillary protein KefG
MKRVTMEKKRLLVLLFHPRLESSRTNIRLFSLASSLGEITVRDMYELYPDFNIDVETEKEILEQHDVVVCQHPFYWYSCPPLMKQWIDLVLEYGWAYGKDGNALRGKWFMNAISSGGTFEVYQEEGRNRHTYREFLYPFEQTARLCQMEYLPPYVVPGANRMTEEEIEDYAIRYLQILNFLQEPAVDGNKVMSADYFNTIAIDTWQDQYFKTH